MNIIEWRNTGPGGAWVIGDGDLEVRVFWLDELGWTVSCPQISLNCRVLQATAESAAKREALSFVAKEAEAVAMKAKKLQAWARKGLKDNE